MRDDDDWEFAAVALAIIGAGVIACLCYMWYIAGSGI